MTKENKEAYLLMMEFLTQCQCVGLSLGETSINDEPHPVIQLPTEMFFSQYRQQVPLLWDIFTKANQLGMTIERIPISGRFIARVSKFTRDGSVMKQELLCTFTASTNEEAGYRALMRAKEELDKPQGREPKAEGNGEPKPCPNCTPEALCDFHQQVKDGLALIAERPLH